MIGAYTRRLPMPPAQKVGRVGDGKPACGLLFCKEGEQLENYTKYKLKAAEELASLLENKDKLFVLACNKCFKEFETDYEPDCEAFEKIAAENGKTVVGSARIDFLCNKTQTDRKLVDLIPDEAENIVVVSCGLGIQTIAEISELPVYAATNSIGKEGHHGMALTEKRCDACAQCYLNMTGGICPIVDCSKSLINGQCGGAKNGKCEVSPDKDCAWEKIQQRLTKQGRLEEMIALPVQLRDYSKVNVKVISEYVKAIREKRFDGWYGGVHPVEDKEPTEAKALVKFPAPKTAVFPMSMHLGAPATPIVAVGDTVKVGQKIGEAAGFISAPVHSSISGKVVAIEERPHASRGTCLSVVVENDGLDTLCESVQPCGKTLDQLEPAEIVEIVKNAGIVGMGGAGFPTYVKLQPGKPIDAVLVNACECEPMLTADHRVLLEYADEIIFGLKAVMKTVAAPKGIIVIEENKPDAIALLKEKVADIEGMEVLEVSTQYPQGGEKMLIKRALGRTVPSGKLPADVGACVTNVSTVKAISDAIKTGMPLIERVATVTGKYIPNPGNFVVKVGTPASELVAACGGIQGECVVKAGGPMMGFVQETLDTPIMKGSNGIITVDEDPAEPQECIKCGRCVDVCPMSLEPLHFAKLVGDPAALKAKNIMDCMECRSCEYICSSKIPLVNLIKIGKNAVRGMK